MGGLCFWQGAAIYNHSTQGKCPMLLGAPYLWVLSIFLCVGRQWCYQNAQTAPSHEAELTHVHNKTHHAKFRLTLVSFYKQFFCFLTNPYRFTRTVLLSSLQCVSVCVLKLWIIHPSKIPSINSTLTLIEETNIWVKKFPETELCSRALESSNNYFPHIYLFSCNHTPCFWTLETWANKNSCSVN